MGSSIFISHCLNLIRGIAKMYRVLLKYMLVLAKLKYLRLTEDTYSLL